VVFLRGLPACLLAWRLGSSSWLDLVTSWYCCSVPLVQEGKRHTPGLAYTQTPVSMQGHHEGRPDLGFICSAAMVQCPGVQGIRLALAFLSAPGSLSFLVPSFLG
jgi:hypothetical protein